MPGGVGVPGGQIGMVQLARFLARGGSEVRLFVGGPRMKYLDGLDGVEPIHFRWPEWLDRLLRRGPRPIRDMGRRWRRRRWLSTVRRLLRAHPVDVIHVQGLEDAETLISAIEGPIVVTHWGRVRRWSSDTDDGQADSALARRLRRLRRNTEIVAIGQAQEAELARVGLPAVGVIPPGIDLDHFTPGDKAAARDHLGLAGGGGIVLYVGRLTPDKNVESLIRAFELLRDHPSRPRLLIVGTGSLRESLRSLSRDLGLDDMVRFIDFVPHHDLPQYFRACDVTVVPSDDLETFCMVGLEAIACRAPLLVTEHVPEITTRFPAVPWVTARDIPAMSREIARALDGDVAPADAAGLAEFGWDAIALKYVSLYKSLGSR
ncbi:glycosyltransferase [Krasilnikovia sp. MM14-A1259]|uniref:glycosyltransferase n=1 Tax=Krasilnikovia sp. MM14-A1259 TaxID=3373539 RepID=UPI00399C54AF